MWFLKLTAAQVFDWIAGSSQIRSSFLGLAKSIYYAYAQYLALSLNTWHQVLTKSSIVLTNFVV